MWTGVIVCDRCFEEKHHCFERYSLGQHMYDGCCGECKKAILASINVGGVFFGFHKLLPRGSISF